MGRFVHTLTRQVGRWIDQVERVPPSMSRSLSSDAIARSMIAIDVLSPALAPGSESEGGAGVSPAVGAWDIPDLTQDPLTAVPSTLPEVEDGRKFTFNPVEPLRTPSGRPVRLRTAKPVKGSLALPHGIRVEAKADVIMCIRRKARRGTLLALGQGGGYHRPPRRSPKSDIWCD